VDVYTVPEIQSPDDPQIEDAVEATRLVFHREGRSFPLGRLTKVFIKEEEAALALENALLAQAAGGEKGEGLVEVEEEDKRRIVLPNFSVIIERSLLDDEIRKIDQEKNKHDYGRFEKFFYKNPPF
jgi:hypothetical protein